MKNSPGSEVGSVRTGGAVILLSLSIISGRMSPFVFNTTPEPDNHWPLRTAEGKTLEAVSAVLVSVGSAAETRRCCLRPGQILQEVLNPLPKQV